MNDVNKGNYEALAGEYEEQQTVLADESAEQEEIRKDERMRDRDAEKAYALAQYGVYGVDPEKERMQRRAEDMVRYGIRLGFIEGDDMEKAIELALEAAKSFTAEQIDTLDAKIKEIDEKNIRAKDERRRSMAEMGDY
jgi:hypothetical protein